MKGLTKRQFDILSFIEQYIERHNFSPSYREIMRNFNLSSVSSVAKLIAILKRKGALSSEEGCGRSLAPTAKSYIGKSSVEVELPYIGYISAQSPIEIFPQSQTLAVPEFLVHNKDRTYVLRADGESLNEEMIADGDLLLVEGRSEAKDGETIVANSDQHGTIVKNIIRKEVMFVLPASRLILPH